MNLPVLCIHRPVMTTLLMAAILIFGTMAYQYLPVSDMPTVDYPTVSVSASLTGASPETMAATVATPLERQFSSIDGVDSINSVSSLGSTRITIQFSLDRDIDSAAQDVQSAISRVQRRLPKDMNTPPSYNKQNPADRPVLFIGVHSSSLPMYEVNEYAENILGRAISMVTGVAKVDIWGGKKYAVRIQLNPDALAAKGVSVANISTAVEKANVNLPNGSLQGDEQSFTIEAGQTIAIVGKTGCGKTTICNLLNRFLNYNSGAIYLDDTLITDIEKHYLRKKVKMVLQDPFLFTKTVYENIAITDDNFNNNDVLGAAKLAYVDEEINHFEKGYRTIVGEKGTTLSGGQKQRIAIARMLISPSPIIIFDDSLSALDTKTDYLIRKALKNKSKRTMIIITHRITTAKEADKILVLNNGQIEDFATHEELINKPGLYQELWQIQGDLETEFNAVLKVGENNV